MSASPGITFYRGVSWALMLCVSSALLSCEDRDWQKDAANTAMEIAREDPGRAGKVGAYAALVVRDHAMRTARRKAPWSLDPLARRSPVCLDFASGMTYTVHARLLSRGSGEEELEWEQWLTWRAHEDGAEHLSSRERYSDGRAVLDGRRLLDLRWKDGERLFRSSMDEEQGAHVRDPMSASTWRTLRDRQVNVMQHAVASVSAWQVEEQEGHPHYTLFRGDASNDRVAVRLVCEGSDSEVWGQVAEKIDVGGMVVQDASLRRMTREEGQGWLFTATWKDGARALIEAEIWLTQAPLDEALRSVHVMEVARELTPPTHVPDENRQSESRGGGDDDR